MTRPSVILLSLEKKPWFDDSYTHLLTALRACAMLTEVLSEKDALARLSASSAATAVLVTDAAVAGGKHKRTLDALVRYAKQGGTVVYCGLFSSFARPDDIDAMFKKAWGLPWKAGPYDRREFSRSGAVKGIDLTGVDERWNVKALQLAGVAPAMAVYTQVGSAGTSPAAYASVGDGRVGYIGDVNGELETTAIILAMCGFNGPKGPTSSAPPSNSHASTSNSTSKSTILVLDLVGENDNNIWTYLLNCIQQQATLHRAKSAAQAVQILSRTPAPSAVFAIDSGLANQEHEFLLQSVVGYARRGGTVVLGGNFGGGMPLNATGRAFFAKWDVPWAPGDYCRTTIHLNTSLSHLSTAGLAASYSGKSAYLKHVPPESVVYAPNAASRLESRVFEPMPVDTAQAAAAYARVGAGCLGYVGEINGEDASTPIVLAMLHLRAEGLPANTIPREYSLTTHRGRIVESTGNEPTLNVDYVRVFGEERTGHKLTPPAPPQPQPQSKPKKAPRRAREAEVEKRRKQRAAKTEEQKAAGEKLKVQGNELFKKQDYKGAARAYSKAADVDAPRAVYMCNLAMAYLKLDMFEPAECAANAALSRDPTLLKARFRRGLASKGLGHMKAAIRDFEKCLKQDSKCTEAQQELHAVHAMFDTGLFDEDSDSDEESETSDDEVVDEDGCMSDSPDCLHEGNGRPCPHYNRSGCRKGPQKCPYKHAPDNNTVRDELGRNICIFHMIGMCNFGSQCFYGHDMSYLPDGWWRSREKRELVHDVLSLTQLSGSRTTMKTWLGPTLKGTNGKKTQREFFERVGPSLRDGGGVALEMLAAFRDLESEVRMVESMGRARGRGKGHAQGKGKGRPRGMGMREREERVNNYGFTEDEVRELSYQGVKPWDDEAMDVLNVLNGNF